MAKDVLSNGEKEVIIIRYNQRLRALADALKCEVRDNGSLDWNRTNTRFLNAARRIMWTTER